MAKKLQPITGVLKLRINGEVKPVEFQEITLTADGRQVTFPTGTGGEFYIDVSQSEEFKKLAEAEESGCAAIATAAIPFIQPGTYRAVLMHEGKQHTFDLVIPPSSDPIIDLGQIVVDTPPEAGKEPPATETSGPEEGMEKVLPARENAAEASAPPGSVPHPAPKTASPEPGNEPPATEVSAAPQVLVPEPAGGTKSAEPASPGSAKPWVPAASEELPPTEVHFRFGSTDVALADDRMFFSLPRVC